MGNEFIRFMLIKKGQGSYTLVALLRKLSKTNNLTHLPFEESETGDKFEKHLIFAYEYGDITELDLIDDQSENPFVDVGTPTEDHMFITEEDYPRPSEVVGDTLIKGWVIRDEKNSYPAQFFEVNEPNGAKYYKICVTHGAK